MKQKLNCNRNSSCDENTEKGQNHLHHRELGLHRQMQKNKTSISNCWQIRTIMLHISTYSHISMLSHTHRHTHTWPRRTSFEALVAPGSSSSWTRLELFVLANSSFYTETSHQPGTQGTWSKCYTLSTLCFTLWWAKYRNAISSPWILYMERRQ